MYICIYYHYIILYIDNICIHINIYIYISTYVFTNFFVLYVVVVKKPGVQRSSIFLLKNNISLYNVYICELILIIIMSYCYIAMIWLRETCIECS